MRKNWQEDEEYLAYVGDLINREEVTKLKTFTHHHYSNRFEHSVSVSYRSFLVAKKVNGNAKATARAGLLHDLFYYDCKTQKKSNQGSHAYLHPRIAVENAGKITALSALEKDIILKHMWLVTAAVPRYKESFIVTFVDKYCAIEEVLRPFRSFVREKWTLYTSFGK